MAISAGKYLIRSALNEDLVLLTVGGSKNKAAKISTGTLTETDNRCYWNVAVNSSYNKINNMKAGKNGYISSLKTQSNNPITQNVFKAATSNWLPVSSGNTMSVNGVDVATYYLKLYNNNDYYLKVPDNGGELFLSGFPTQEEQETVGTANYEFYFEPSTTVGTSLATPKMLTTADGNTYVIASGATTFYPQWQSSKSSKIYEMRYRSRRYDAEGNLITEVTEGSGPSAVTRTLEEGWDYWTGWSMIQATPQLNSKKKYNGTMKSGTTVSSPAVDNTNYTKAETQVEVRLTSASKAADYNTSKTHGAAVSQLISHYCNPTLSFSAAVYSPDGLALTYATNYTVAGSSITIHSITDGSTVLIKDYTFTGQDYQGELYLNCDELYSIPSNGDSIVINATITEENGVAKTTITSTLTVSYDQSSGLSISPTYELTNRLTVKAEIQNYDFLQLFLEHKQLDGTTLWVPCDNTGTTTRSGVTYSVFEFAPPYGTPPNLMWIAINSQAQWTSTIIEPSGVTVDSKFYSWFWLDEQGVPRATILKYQIDHIMKPSDEITLPAYKFVTTGREYPVFRYAKSVERKLDIDGIILNGESDNYCTVADFERMAVANHCVYRQPDGKWYQVAITGINFSREEGYIKVKIEQEAETR